MTYRRHPPRMSDVGTNCLNIFLLHKAGIGEKNVHYMLPDKRIIALPLQELISNLVILLLARQCLPDAESITCLISSCIVLTKETNFCFLCYELIVKCLSVCVYAVMVSIIVLNFLGSIFVDEWSVQLWRLLLFWQRCLLFSAWNQGCKLCL